MLGAVGAGSNAGPHFCWGSDSRASYAASKVQLRSIRQGPISSKMLNQTDCTILVASLTRHQPLPPKGPVFEFTRTMMINLGKLRGEHAKILSIVAKLRQLIAGASPPPPLHLLRLRHELASTLIGGCGRIPTWRSRLPRMHFAKRWADWPQPTPIIASDGRRMRSRPTGPAIAAKAKRWPTP